VGDPGTKTVAAKGKGDRCYESKPAFTGNPCHALKQGEIADPYD
jgi:hypothetical protein